MLTIQCNITIWNTNNYLFRSLFTTRNTAAAICGHHLSNIASTNKCKSAGDEHSRKTRWSACTFHFYEPPVMLIMSGIYPNPLMENRGGVPGSRLWVKRDCTACLAAITRVASASPPDVCINICGASAFGVLSMLLHRERRMSRMNVPFAADIYTSFRRNDRNTFAR